LPAFVRNGHYRSGGLPRCATDRVDRRVTNKSSNHEGDALVEHLREFLRYNYMTGAQAARRIGVRPETLYPWLQGKSRPKDIEPIIAFLDCMPAERTGIMPTGCEYREYKNELL
jgi:hypothetical protein